MMMVELHQVGHNNDYLFFRLDGVSFVFYYFFIDNIYTGFTSSLLFYHNIIRNRSASNG